MCTFFVRAYMVTTTVVITSTFVNIDTPAMLVDIVAVGTECTDGII